MSPPPSAERLPDEGLGRAVLLVCGLAIFLDVAGSGMVVPAIPEFAALFSASDAAMSYGFAAFAAAFLITILPLGLLVDRTGRNGLVVVGGISLIAVGGLCFALADSLVVFGLGQAFHGVGSAATWVAAQPLAARVISGSQRKGLWFSTITITMGLGLVVGPLIGIIGSFRTPFWIFVALTLGTLLLAGVVLRSVRGPEHEDEYRYTAVLRNRRVLGASAAILVLYAGVGMAEVLFPLFMDGHGYPKQGIGLLFSLFALCMVVSQPLAGRWIDRAGPARPMIVGMFVAALLLAAAVLGESPAVWNPVFALLGLAMGAPISASMVMIATGCGAAQHGAAYSLWNFSFSVGYLLGPVLGGTVAHLSAGPMGSDSGGLRLAFFVLSACILAAVPVVGWLAGRPRCLEGSGISA